MERGRHVKNVVFVALEGVWGKGAWLDVSLRGCLCPGLVFALTFGSVC